MNDCIFINDLTVSTIIGILPHERENKQPIMLDIELYFDFGEAAASDDFSQTIDYAGVTKKLKQHIEATQCQLIETLSENICQWIFDNYPVEKIRLCLTKPNALPDANVGVKIERERKERKYNG